MTGFFGIRQFAAAAVAVMSLQAPVRAEEISVTQWGASLYGAPYAVAMEKGLFKQAGIDITGIIGSGGGGTTVRNILASATPYGEVAVSAALAAKAQGLDLIIVNTGTRSVAEASMVTMPNSEVKSVEDLVGKKIAITSPKSVSEMLFLMVLKEKGIDQSKVQRVAAGGYVPALTMLEQGAIVGSVLIEPLSIIRKDKYRTVYKAGDILKPMTTSVGITTRKFAQENPDKLKAIIAGRRAGVQAIYKDPAETAKIIEKLYKLEPAVAKEAVDNMIGPKMWSEGEFNVTELNRMVEGLKLIGEVKNDVDWSTILDKSFLPADLQAKQ
ncbi:ABC transporter substrate-binding protein [Bosea rubneri]|uniref:ABC transporter substrate-binding protein n=1 Tax=Bosea rubneri TaxID=3075434 RepID=A0ABU3S9B0_9HYPH|nr:ABC transporter substrate-binding protein [Bosea sp. ZW T0_25]MDU0341375.1 ABC transporter substrate-binding protein [Bosea sp. ZW T0_25]